MKKIMIMIAGLVVALGLSACSLPAGGGRPDVPAAAVSPVAGSPAESPDAAACRAARALNTAGATSADYAALATVVSRAEDDDLAEAGVALQRASAGGVGARSSFYAKYLDVMSQCLRFPEPSAS